ncbi:hypothetical protein ACIQVL_28005 [Streptomyces sp. NPDC090499]
MFWHPVSLLTGEDLNHRVATMLKYAGAAVDGVPSAVYPPLLQSTARY